MSLQDELINKVRRIDHDLCSYLTYLAIECFVKRGTWCINNKKEFQSHHPSFDYLVQANRMPAKYSECRAPKLLFRIAKSKEGLRPGICILSKISQSVARHILPRCVWNA